LFVFIALAAFDNIVIGLFPPLFGSIAQDINVDIAALGFVSALNIFVTSVSSIGWGYLAGKFNRKILIMIGTFFWSASVFLTSISHTYIHILIFQLFTGIGLGCIGSIGFSILTDFIPQKRRGVLLSLWGMSQGFGGIAGALMASLIAPTTSWRKPFEVVSIIGFLLMFLYIFVKEPSIGEAEPELKELVDKGHGYDYDIKLGHLREIILKPSNILLFFQAFFMNIAIGTLIWLPTLYISKIEDQGYNAHISIVAAGYLYALFQVGGLTSSFFGHMGDKIEQRSYRGRALLTAFFVLLTVPFYILMFIVPMNNLRLTQSNNAYLIFIDLIKQIVINPWITIIFILSVLASAAQSANTPNWLALITNVNLPEHRAAAFSIANLATGIGRTIGNAGVGFMLGILSVKFTETNKYVITLIVFQLFLIPSGFCYLKMAKSNARDIRRVKMALKRRGNIS
jgi:MFS family permease